MGTSRSLRGLAASLERAAALDPAGEALGKAARGLLGRGVAKDALSGTWLGHPAHPPLTDVVIGAFFGASLLDLLAPASHTASRRLLAAGIVAALPTAATGLSDWADSEAADARVRRVGLIHATANVSALTLSAASLAARRRDSIGLGRALSGAGAAMLAVGGFIGGHMSYTLGVGPNQTAFDAGPEEWTALADVAELEDGKPLTRTAGDTPVLLVRHGERIHAVHDRCSHRGCSLSEGELDGHLITCSCHGSQFDIRDGAIVRGPATSPQPVLDAREQAERIEVRARSSS